MSAKHLFASLALFLMVPAVPWADEIFLKDGKVIKGKNIRVTDRTVRYETEQGKPADEIDADKVDRIVYDDGRTQNIVPSLPPDVIHLYDGTTITGRMARVTDRYIAYYPQEASFLQIIDIGLAVKVVYGDGRVQELGRGAADKKKQEDAGGKDKPAAPQLSAGLRAEYLKWTPVFARYNNQDYLRKSNRYALPASPHAGASVSYSGGRWGADLDFVYGRYGKKKVRDYEFVQLPQASEYDISINSYQASALLTYSPGSMLKWHLGPRYEGFVCREKGISLMQITVILPGPIFSYYRTFVPMSGTTAFHAGGPELGFSLRIPLVLGLYLSPRISALALYGTRILMGERGNTRASVSIGIDSSAVLGWKPSFMGLGIEAGMRYRFLHYLYDGASSHLRRWENRYGFIAGLKYLF